MNTESDWSSENRYQEPVPAEEPQRTARYSWDWPENLAPWWTPPPGLVPPQWGAAAVADSNQPRDEYGSEDEPDSGAWDDDPADQQPYDQEVADLEPADHEPDEEEVADLEPTDQEPADGSPTARDLADEESAGDEEAWPGVAPAAGWFLRSPDQDGRGALDEDGRGALDEDGRGALDEDGLGARDEDGRGDATAIAAGAVPWPRRESDSAWPPSSGSPTLAPQHRDELTGGNGSSPAGAWSVSGAGLPTEPVVGATRALWGRAGGPGFQPGRPGPGTRRAPVEPSPWQKSEGMWRDSGIQWEQRPAESGPPPRPAAPASYPRQQAKPSPLPPRRTPVTPPAAPAPASPPRYAGRHAGPGSVPIGPGSVPIGPVNGTWPGPTQALLSAPVYAEAEPEPREDRGALRVDGEPARPWEGSPEWEGSSGWDRSFGWERASGTAELVTPANSRRGGTTPSSSRRNCLPPGGGRTAGGAWSPGAPPGWRSRSSCSSRWPRWPWRC